MSSVMLSQVLVVRLINLQLQPYKFNVSSKLPHLPLQRHQGVTGGQHLVGV
jgi:hypothetical protein